MQRDPRAWLWDVRDAAASIGEFTVGADADGSANSSGAHLVLESKRATATTGCEKLK